MRSLFGDDVTKFIDAHTVAVLATANDSAQPHSSTIYYDTFSKQSICFITRSGTTKYKNLLENNQAAMTIIDFEQPIAVNLVGVAKKVDDPSDHDKIMQKILKRANSKHTNYPPVLQLKEGSFVAFIFEPSSATLTDYTDPENKMRTETRHYA